MNIERFGAQEETSEEEIALEKYRLEFDQMAHQMNQKPDPAAREKYARAQLQKKGIPKTVSDAKPPGLEISRGERGPVSAKETQGNSSRIAGVNPDMITRPGDSKFNEEKNPGNYGGGVPEELLERDHRDQPGEYRAH